MLSRSGITVALIRASDGQEFPEHILSEFAKEDRQNNRAITVVKGDLFFPRVTVLSSFAWYDANVLELMVNYNNGASWSRDHYFTFPRIPKPETTETITFDLVRCPFNENGLANLSSYSTQFTISKWSKEVFEQFYRMELSSLDPAKEELDAGASGLMHSVACDNMDAQIGNNNGGAAKKKLKLPALPKNPRLPDQSMCRMYRDSAGELYNRWAHVEVVVRRLWDPSLAKPNDPEPFESQVDDFTAVNEESNVHDDALNIEFVDPQRNELVLPHQPAHRLWDPPKQTRSILVDSKHIGRRQGHRYLKIHFKFHCNVTEMITVEPIDLTGDSSRSSSVEFLSETTERIDTLPISDSVRGIKRSHSDDELEEGEDNLDVINNKIELQRLMIKKAKVEGKQRSRNSIKEEEDRKVKLEGKEFVII